MYPKLRECPSVKLMSFPTPGSLQHEILSRYLFNQFFCGHLDRLGGNMSAVMERPPSQNRTQQSPGNLESCTFHILQIEFYSLLYRWYRNVDIYADETRLLSSFHITAIQLSTDHIHSSTCTAQTAHPSNQWTAIESASLVAAFWRWWKVVITLWSLCAVSRPRWGESGIFIVTCEGQHQHQQSLQQTVGTTWAQLRPHSMFVSRRFGYF